MDSKEESREGEEISSVEGREVYWTDFPDTVKQWVSVQAFKRVRLHFVHCLLFCCPHYIISPFYSLHTILFSPLICSSTPRWEGGGAGAPDATADSHTAAYGEDHAGKDGYFLKELQPVERPRWSRGKVWEGRSSRESSNHCVLTAGAWEGYGNERVPLSLGEAGWEMF